jgi:hypothetical protein
MGFVNDSFIQNAQEFKTCPRFQSFPAEAVTIRPKDIRLCGIATSQNFFI